MKIKLHIILTGNSEKPLACPGKNTPATQEQFGRINYLNTSIFFIVNEKINPPAMLGRME